MPAMFLIQDWSEPDIEHVVCKNVEFYIQFPLFFPCSGTLRVWELDLPNRKIRPTECQMGQLKRVIKCVEVGGVLFYYNVS